MGGHFNFDDHGITLKVPKGAIPSGRVVHFEVGIALPYGPFEFPSGMHPISSILWLCPQEDVNFDLPLEIVMPHFLTEISSKEELNKFKICFARADHNEYTRVRDQPLYDFKLLEEDQRFSLSNEDGSFGVLQTRRCYYLCILASITSETASMAGYCFTQIELSKYHDCCHIFFCASFLLQSCIKVSRTCTCWDINSVLSILRLLHSHIHAGSGPAISEKPRLHSYLLSTI